MEILKLTNELFPKKFRDDINRYAEIVLNYYKRNSEDDFKYHSEYLMKCDTRISWLKKYTDHIKANKFMINPVTDQLIHISQIFLTISIISLV